MQNVYKITVYKNHSEEYITFCSPECVKTIDDYLAYRERYDEKLKSFSPLIREQFDKTDADAAVNAKDVGVKTIESILYRAIKCNAVTRT